MAEVRNLVHEIVHRDLNGSPIEISYVNYHELLYHTQQIWNRIYNSVGREKTRLNLVYARHLLELLEQFPEEATNDIEVKCLTALGNFCTSMAEAPSDLTSDERIDYALSALSCFRARNDLMPLNATSLTLVRVALQVYLSTLVELRAPQADYDFTDLGNEIDEDLDPFHTLVLQTASNRNTLRNNTLFDLFRARARNLIAQGKRGEFEKAFVSARAYIDVNILSPERRTAWQNFKLETEIGQSREQLAEAREAEMKAAAEQAAAAAEREAKEAASRPAQPAVAAQPLAQNGSQPSAESDYDSRADDEDGSSFEDELATHLGPIRSPRVWLEQKMTPNDPQRGTSMPQSLFQFVQGGIDSYKMGEYEAALRQFNQADLQNPNPGFRHVILYNRAASLLAMNDNAKSAEAEQLLEQATAIGSRLPGLRWNLAVAYWRNHGVDRRLINTLNEVVDAGRKAPLCAAAACYLLGDSAGALDALLRARALPGSVPDIDEELRKLVADYPQLAPQISAEIARNRPAYAPAAVRLSEDQPYQPDAAYPPPAYNPQQPYPNQPYNPQQPYAQPRNPYVPAQQPYGQPQQPYGQPPTQPQQPYGQPPTQPPPNGQPQQPYQPYPRNPYQPERQYGNNQPYQPERQYGGNQPYQPERQYGGNQPYQRPYQQPERQYGNNNQPYQPYQRPYQQPERQYGNNNQPYQPYQRPYQPGQGYGQPPTREGATPTDPRTAAASPNPRLGQLLELHGKLIELILPFTDAVAPDEDLQRSQLEFDLTLTRLEQQQPTLDQPTQQMFTPIIERWRRLGAVMQSRVSGGLEQGVVQVRPGQRQISDGGRMSGLVVAVTNTDEATTVTNLELCLPTRPDSYQLPTEVAEGDEGLALRVPQLDPGATRYLKFNLAPQYQGSLDLVFNLSYELHDLNGSRLHRSHVLLQPAVTTARLDPVPSYYLAGESIPDDRDDIFKGRVEDIARIKASLGVGDSNPRQSVIPYLTGISKVGKSSLLNNLTNPRLHPDLHQSYVPIRISMDEYQGDEYKMPFFLKALAGKIGKAMQGAGYNPPSIDPLWSKLREAPLITFFDEYLAQVNEMLRPRRLLLMFDEFRYLADKLKMGEWDSGFLSKLRTLYQNGQVALIFAGRGYFSEVNRGLNEPSLLDSVRDQPLGFLSPQAVRELIEQPSQMRGIGFVPEAGALIQQLTAGHPFFVQSLCHDVISEILNRERRRVVIPDDVRAINKLYMQSDNLFSHIWAGSEMREVHQEVIFALLQAQESGDSYVDRGQIVAAVSGYAPREVATALEFLRNREVLEESPTSEHFVRIHIPILRGWFQSKYSRGLSLAPSRADRLQDIQNLTEQVIRVRRKCNQWQTTVFKEDASDQTVATEMMQLAAESWADFERFEHLLYKFIGNEAILAREYLREAPRFGELVRDLQAIRNGVAHRLDNDRYPDSADAAYKAIDKYLGHQPVTAGDFLELQELILRATISGLNELREALER